MTPYQYPALVQPIPDPAAIHANLYFRISPRCDDKRPVARQTTSVSWLDYHQIEDSHDRARVTPLQKYQRFNSALVSALSSPSAVAACSPIRASLTMYRCTNAPHRTTANTNSAGQFSYPPVL